MLGAAFDESSFLMVVPGLALGRSGWVLQLLVVSLCEILLSGVFHAA